MEQTATVFGRFVDAVPVEVVPGALRRTIAIGERQMIVHWTFQAGAVIPLHRHPHEQVGTVLTGRIIMTVDGRSEEMHVGDSWVVHSNVEHGATALEEATVLDIFSPPRDDYRPQSAAQP